MDKQSVIESTRRWISSVVIGLNLCPFANRVFQGELIRYAVSNATDEEELFAELRFELQHLARTPISQIETTVLIHPEVLADFLEFNDFLAIGNKLIASLGLRGIIQIASFHPKYQFEDSKPDDVENYTNRSPYPMLHLLREESITKVAVHPEELLEIPQRNIKQLKSLGPRRMLDMLKETVPEGPSST